MNTTPPSLTPSATIISNDTPRSEEAIREDNEGFLGSVLHDGTEAIREALQLIWDEDHLDMEAYYRRASRVQDEIRAEESLPPLNLPEWDDVKPDRVEPSTLSSGDHP
jgi:hypothetical protein